MRVAWYQREGCIGKVRRTETPEAGYVLCLDYEASDEDLEDAFAAWAPFAPQCEQWQVADILESQMRRGHGQP